MSDYYVKHEGDLFPGRSAKSSDINIIQQNTQDAIKNAINDLTEGESWILGTGSPQDENAFILVPDVKRNGRYIDQMVLAEGEDADMVSIREVSYRQPITLSRSSVYSIIVKMQNKSELDVPVVFELHDENGLLIPNMRTVLNLPKNTNTPKEFEVVFDLDYYPTAHGISPTELSEYNPQLVIQNTDEASFESGIDHGNEEKLENISAGASVIYLYIEALNKNKQKVFDVNTQQDDGYMWNDTDPTFGLVINKNSKYGQLLEENTGSGFTRSSVFADIYFKEIYANSPTYQCQVGQAIINGSKVGLADTHVSIGGASSFGNVISYVYMDEKGHLRAQNSDPFNGSEPANPIQVTEPHLHIANIITYANDVKDPIIEQSDETQIETDRSKITRPRSHHERIRRLEKKMLYTQDIAIPPRLKYTLTGESWIDTNPGTDLTSSSYDGSTAKALDSLDKKGYVITTDKDGNFIVKVSEAESFSIPITLKSNTSGKVTTNEDKTSIISEAQTSEFINALKTDDISRAQTFAEIKDMSVDITNGKLTLAGKKNETGWVAKTDEEAKKTEFNPWDDDKSNRPTDAKAKPITRQYDVVSGKNGANDWASEFPAMTFYTNTTYKLKKLEVPIYKFKNCTGIKFIIWKRQGPNNKQNTVWYEKRMYTSKVFSLDKAKTKDGYQYMDDGFLIDFGSSGLTLPKGQYVIVCFPIVASGTGTVYVDTYKPANSKDFCIRYHGAANGSHFLLKTRYHEIWYNSVKASGEAITYAKKGSITSGVVSWKNKENIKSVKPIANLTTPDGTKAKIYVDVGGGWKEVENNKDNSVTGSGTGESFKWKIEFEGNTKETPTLAYDDKKKYALSFQITRAEPSTSKMTEFRTLDKNLCLTSKVFDGNRILRDYIGDMNIAIDDNKFSNFEFARVWGTDSSDKSLLIDISASDTIKEIKDSNNNPVVDENGKQLYYPLYSLHYVDLTLDDMENTSVDYNNYDPTLEEDEHNLRLKLDTENSYNDADIKIVNPNDFVVDSSLLPTTTNSEENNESSEEESSNTIIDLRKIVASESNQTLAKATFTNTLDFSKYAGVKIGIKLNGDTNGTVSGLALYVSSQNEIDTPSNLNNENVLDALPDGLPDLNSAQEDIIAQYSNQIVVDIVNDNGTAQKVYYKSVWNSTEQKWEWQMLHDVRSYNLYELINRSTKTNTLQNTGSTQYYEMSVDPNSINLQYVKEIGLIILNDEGKYTNSSINTIEIVEFTAIRKDYYSAFTGYKGDVFKKANERSPVKCLANGKLEIHSGNTTIKKTTPQTSSIEITHQDVLESGEELCYFDMTSKSTENFNHIGIRIASDCLLTKNMLEVHLKKIDSKGIETTIEKIRLPTINYVYYPTTSEDEINLSQVFKKIKTTEKFDKISIVATNRFKNYAKKLKGDLGDTITLYIGYIVLYKARTIPIFHSMMRMKFYLDEANSVSRDQIGIRKIGAILEYK